MNVCFNDSLMEHNTAAVQFGWRADINVRSELPEVTVYMRSGMEINQRIYVSVIRWNTNYHAYP